MLKKTVAGAALMTVALAMSVPASAHAVPGASGVNASVSGTAQDAAYYRYGHPGYHHYYRPYAYRGYAYRPYAYGGYPGYYGWGYPTGYWGGYGWGPGVSIGVAPGFGIGFGF
jgi:hypothetical protein